MLPILQREISDKRGWASEEELSEYFAIGQCTPGIIAVNTATFVGYSRCGVIGGVAATLGLAAPSFVIIGLLANVISLVRNYSIVIHAFEGIRIGVCVTIFNAVLKMIKKTVRGKANICIFLAVLFLTLLSFASPVWLVVLSGCAGLFIQGRKGKAL